MDSLHLSLPDTLFVADVNDNAPVFENALCNANVRVRVAVEEKELRVAAINSQQHAQTILENATLCKKVCGHDSWICSHKSIVSQ